MVSHQPQPRGNDSEEWLSSILSTSPEWTPRGPEILAEESHVLKEQQVHGLHERHLEHLKERLRPRDEVPERPRRSRSAAHHVERQTSTRSRAATRANLSPRWQNWAEGTSIAGMGPDKLMAKLGARVVAQDQELRRQERMIRHLQRKAEAEKENVSAPYYQDGFPQQTGKEARWARSMSPPPVERKASRTSLGNNKEVDLKLRRAELRFERRLRRRAEKMATVAWRQSAMFGGVAALFGLGCITLVFTLLTR